VWQPGFFSERRPLFSVDPADGALRNTDGGAPIIPIGSEDLPAENVSRARAVCCVQDRVAAAASAFIHTRLASKLHSQRTCPL
jgi:hypothetical protein